MAISALTPILDESQWPIVVAILPNLALSDDEFLGFLGRISACCRRGQPFGLVVDVRKAPPLAPAQRRILAERLDEDAERYPNVMCGVGVVLSNSVQRGIVMVLTWLMRKPFAIRPCSSIDDAVGWCRSLVAEPFKNAHNA